MTVTRTDLASFEPAESDKLANTAPFFTIFAVHSQTVSAFLRCPINWKRETAVIERHPSPRTGVLYERNREPDRAKNRRERSEENKQRGASNSWEGGGEKERGQRGTIDILRARSIESTRDDGVEEKRKRVHEEGVPVVDGCGRRRWW